MSQTNTRKALFQELNALALGIPLVGPNMKRKDLVPGDPSAEVSVVFNQPQAVTLGSDGEDELTGFMQVLLKYPFGEGDEAALIMADSIRDGFFAGKKCLYGGQEVTIRNSGVNTPYHSDGEYILPVTINWYARTGR